MKKIIHLVLLPFILIGCGEYRWPINDLNLDSLKINVLKLSHERYSMTLSVASLSINSSKWPTFRVLESGIDVFVVECIEAYPQNNYSYTRVSPSVLVDAKPGARISFILRDEKNKLKNLIEYEVTGNEKKFFQK